MNFSTFHLVHKQASIGLKRSQVSALVSNKYHLDIRTLPRQVLHWYHGHQKQHENYQFKYGQQGMTAIGSIEVPLQCDK